MPPLPAPGKMPPSLDSLTTYVASRMPVFLAAIALLTFGNTLHASFAFDDNYAIQRNKDVMDPTASWFGLLKHDFWGQNIWKPDSHKSYRYVGVHLGIPSGLSSLPCSGSIGPTRSIFNRTRTRVHPPTLQPPAPARTKPWDVRERARLHHHAGRCPRPCSG